MPDYEVLTAKVSSRSTIDVRCILYTVPSRLIGRQLEIHLYHDRLVAYLGKHPVAELPRLRATAKDKRRARCINYRHVIEGLRRKPRAFIYCTWRDDLLPNDHYRQLWQQLKAGFELDSAAVLIVEALYIAATQNKEKAVADYLESQLSAHTLTLEALRHHFQLLSAAPLPLVTVQQHDLATYDQLLSPTSPIESIKPITSSEPVSEPQRPSQKPTALPYAQPLGIASASGDARTVVLRPVLASTLRIGGGQALEPAVETDIERSPVPRRKNGFQLRLEPYPQLQPRPTDAASHRC